MAKKKLIPEYNFSLGKDAQASSSTVRNIYDKIDNSEKSFYQRISELKNNQSNNNISMTDIIRNFIRKNVDDSVSGEISFNKGIKSANYTPGLGGVGFRMYNDDNGKGILDIDNINVREAIYTTVLTYNKVNSVGGSIVISAAWCTVLRSEISGSDEFRICTVWFKPEGYSAQPWAIGDQVRMQRGLDKMLYTHVKDLSIEPNENGEYWIDLYMGYNPISKIGDSTPVEGDVLVQWGNKDPLASQNRKNIIIISSGDGGSEYPYIEQYVGVDSFDLSNKLMARISSDVYFGSPDKSKYLWWNKENNSEFLIKGVLTQSPSEDTSPLPVWRGEWANDVTYYKGDLVGRLGSTYICMENGNIDDDPVGQAEWSLYTKAGNDTVYIVLSNQNGRYHVDGSGTKLSNNTPTYINVYYGLNKLECSSNISTDPNVNLTWNIKSIITSTEVEYEGGALSHPDDYTYSSDGIVQIYPLVDYGYIDFEIAVMIDDSVKYYTVRQNINTIRNGLDGETGSVGQSVRYSNWINGNIYFAGNINDGGTGNNPNRYIDYVTFENGGIVRAYKCKSYHIASAGINSPDVSTTYWEQVSYFPVIASNIVLANQAVIGGFVFSEAIDASGNAIPAEQQEIRTSDDPINPAIRLRGDGSGQLAKGNISWDNEGLVTIGKSESERTIKIITGEIPTLSAINNHEYYDIDSHNETKELFYSNPADDPWIPEINRDIYFNIDNNAHIYINSVYNAYGYNGTYGVGLDANIELYKKVGTSWSSIAHGSPVSSVLYEFYDDTGIFLEKGSYKIEFRGYCGGIPDGINPSIAINLVSIISIQLIVKKLVIGINGIALYDTTSDNYMRLSLDEDGVLNIRGNTTLVSPNGIYGLRITDSGIEKLSGGSWVAATL